MSQIEITSFIGSSDSELYTVIVYKNQEYILLEHGWTPIALDESIPPLEGGVHIPKRGRGRPRKIKNKK